MGRFLEFLRRIFVISVWILTAVLAVSEAIGIMSVVCLTIVSLNLLYLLWLIPLVIVTAITIYFGHWACENMA